jgi:hypothetical protein
MKRVREMEKVLILCIVIALGFGASGATCLNSVMSSGPVGFMCQPSPDQQATAAKMLAALDAAQAIASSFYPAAGIFKASAVLTTIKNGGCFLLTELAEVFKVVDAANTATMQTQMKMLKGSVTMVVPEYAPLRKLVK